MVYPKFSVLMSVYFKENPKYLEQSIQSLLNQTVVPSEIVIVKDGLLTVELDEILNKYVDDNRFLICGYENNKGLGLALNYGVNMCSYEIIARMDSDDICAPNRFEEELNVLIKGNVSLLGSNTQEFIDVPSNIQSQRNMPENHDDIVNYSRTRNPFIHPSIITYKKVLLDCGNFQDNYLCEDYDMWTRILEKGYKAYNIQKNLVYMRVSKDFYKRRGGIKYCKAIVKFKHRLYKKGYMTFFQYQKTKFATIVVSLMPGGFREFFYKKCLRKT